MTQNVNAEIVAIGTEILLGEITDTNSVFIARVLRDLGINLYFMTSVGDNEGRIADSIRIALSRAQIVITCGGLGPTIDDMTRQGVAAATDRGLTFHQHLYDRIAQRFAGFRGTMTENNRRQAFVPDNAIIIENPVGTAPSFIVEHGDGVVISLPGVPREMKFLMNEGVVPYLREKFALGTNVIKAKVLRTAGIGESALDDLIGTALLEAANPTVGLAAHSGQVDVRITAKAESVEEADAMIAVVETELRSRIDPYVFGIDDAAIESALVSALKSQGGRVAVCEAGIGDTVSRRLIAESGGASVLARAEQFADRSALCVAVDGDPNGSLRTLAEKAAQAVREATGALVGIAVVSHGDDTQDHADTVEGSAIGVATAREVRSRVWGFGGNSETAESWTGTWAMSTAWRMVTELGDAG